MVSGVMKFLNVTSSGDLVYKIALICGFILSYVWFHERIKRRLKIKEHIILLTFLVIVGVGVLGGMYLGDGIGLLLFGFLPNIEAIVPVSILVTILLVIYIAKSVLKTSFTTISDSLALPLALGYPLGRIGCLFEGCCYGAPTNLWMGCIPTLLGNSKVNIHPTQVYYIISAVVVLLVLIYFEKRKDINFPGFITLLTIFCYSIFTFAIAFFRGDYSPILAIGKMGVNPEHIVSAAFMFLSLFVMVSRKKNTTDKGGNYEKKTLQENWSVLVVIPIILVLIANINPWLSEKSFVIKFLTNLSNSIKTANGPIGDLDGKYPKIIVPCTEGDDSNYVITAKTYASLYAEDKRNVSIGDKKITEKDMEKSSILFFGSLDDNKTLRELEDILPIKPFRSSIIAGENKFEDDSLCTVFVTRNPFNSHRYFAVYSGVTPSALEMAISKSIPCNQYDFIITNQDSSVNLKPSFDGGFYYAKGFFENKDKAIWSFPELPFLEVKLLNKTSIGTDRIKLSLEINSSAVSQIIGVDRFTETRLDEYAGLGFSHILQLDKKIIKITEVLQGSPAEEAGIKPGFEFTKVNGFPVSPKDDYNALSKTKGQVGDKVTLTCRVNNIEKDFTLIIRKIKRQVMEEKINTEILKKSIIGKQKIELEISGKVDEIILVTTDTNRNSVMKKLKINR